MQSFWIDRSKRDGRHYCCIRCGDRKALDRAERGRIMDEVFLRVGLRWLRGSVRDGSDHSRAFPYFFRVHLE